MGIYSERVFLGNKNSESTFNRGNARAIDRVQRKNKVCFEKQLLPLLISCESLVIGNPLLPI